MSFVAHRNPTFELCRRHGSFEVDGNIKVGFVTNLVVNLNCGNSYMKMNFGKICFPTYEPKDYRLQFISDWYDFNKSVVVS